MRTFVGSGTAITIKTISLSLFSTKTWTSPLRELFSWPPALPVTQEHSAMRKVGELGGIELEGKKEFVLDEGFSKTVFTSFNISLIESEVSLSSGKVRALQGQPEYTANLIIGYDDVASGQELTFL